MPQSSLGEMIIRIVGDTALFDSSVDKSKITLNKFYTELEKADAEFKKLADAAKKADLEKNLNLKKAIDQTKKLGGDLSKYVTLPIIALGTLAVKNFADAEDAEAGFNAALLATGKQAEISIANIKALTAEFQKTTIYEDDAQLAALGLVQSLSNLSEEGLKKVLPRMLDFSAAMKVDLQTAASLFGKTLGSTTNALGRYGIQIEDGVEGEERLVALTTALDSKFKGYAETTSKLGTGPMKQLLVQLGDLGESFGAVILPVLNEIIPTIKEAITAFGNLDSGTKKTIVVLAALAAAVGPVLSVGAKLVSLVTTIGSSFAAIAGVGGPILVVAAAIGITAFEMAKYRKNTEETIAIQQGFIKVVEGSRQSIDDFKNSLIFFDASLPTIQANIKATDKQIADIEKTIESLQKGISNQGPVKLFTFESMKTDPVAKQRQEIAKLREELEKLKVGREKLIEQQNKLLPLQKQDADLTKQKTISGLEEFLLERKEIENKQLLVDFNSILQKQAEDEIDLVNAKIKAKEEEAEKEKEFQDIIKNTAKYTQQGFGLLDQMATTLSNNRMVALDDEYNKQKENIESAITDETEKKTALEALDADYNKKKKAEKKKAATAEKTWAMVSAIINTAAGIAEAIPNIPMMILAGVTGAAQVAIIAAQKIPEFATGAYVPSSSKGYMARIAEDTSARGEWIIPDRNDYLDKLASRLQSVAPINTVNNNVTNNNQGMPNNMILSIDGQQFKAYINNQSARGNIKISPRSLSKR